MIERFLLGETTAPSVRRVNWKQTSQNTPFCFAQIASAQASLQKAALNQALRFASTNLSTPPRLETKGVGLRVLDFGGSEIDTKSPSGKMILTMMGAIAEFERSLMLERQREGIAKAKADGRYRGRAPTALAKSSQVMEMKAAGIRPGDIAAQCSISRSSVHRIIAKGGRA